MTDSSSVQDRKIRNPLLPLRHPQRDFFVCDIFDAAPKSDQASMEYPLFSLATKPDMQGRRYDQGDNWLELSPSTQGLATVFDRDILIYCISQCMAALNEGRKVHKTIRFSAHDLLQATNRNTSDKGYAGLKAGLFRLRNTAIETNIRMGGQETLKGFGFIDAYEIIRETRDGRMQAVEVTLSDWLFNAIDAKGRDILTLSPQYFQLRKPLERRLYEIARKSCGTKNRSWKYKQATLHRKTGSKSTLTEFKRMLKAIVDTNANESHIPDYTFELVGNDFIIRPRSRFADIYNPPTDLFNAALVLKPDTHNKAREVAFGWDIHLLEQEWREWIGTKSEPPKNPDASFIGFCRQRGPYRNVAVVN